MSQKKEKLMLKLKPIHKNAIIKILAKHAKDQNTNINNACLELIYYYNQYLLDIDYQSVRSALNFLNKIIKEHKIANKKINKDLLKTVLIKHYHITQKQLDNMDKYLL